MNVRERVLASRLLGKMKADGRLAEKIGLSGELRETRRSPANTPHFIPREKRIR